MNARAPILVGIDGGEASAAALEMAICEARLRQTQVQAMTCWPSADRRDDAGPLICSTHEQATALLEHVIEEVQRCQPHDVLIVHEVTKGPAGQELVAASRHAALLVLGSTTRGRHGRHHGRETIEDCLLYAECPILIVPWINAALDQTDIDIDLHQTPQST